MTLRNWFQLCHRIDQLDNDSCTPTFNDLAGIPICYAQTIPA